MDDDPHGSAPARVVEVTVGDVPISRSELAWALCRSLGVVLVTLLVYALLPIHGDSAALAVVISALVGLVGVAVVFARQLMRISRARRPTLAAVESLFLVFGMFLSLFAFIYVSLSEGDPTSFTEPVGKVAGVYFSVTVLATVGFGDITPVSSLARVLVTLQMCLDLVLIGAAVKALGMSARRAAQARRTAARTTGGGQP